MTQPTAHTLDVPGARLYYEVQGSGPTLMFIGHPMGISGFASIAPLLADVFTVVAYDPRGFEHSTIDDADQDGEPDLLADDVRRVLEAVGNGPARVFGSSGGAITGLALVTHHPELVTTLIAHEPPVALLLPEAEEARAELHQIYDTYHHSGSDAAWSKFAAFTGMTIPGLHAPVNPQPPTAEEMVTSGRFFTHGLLPIALYQPDLPALEAAPTRLIVAGGTTSKGEFPQRTAVALAEHLGTTVMDFPGGHGGFASDPEEFAARLRPALA